LERDGDALLESAGPGLEHLDVTSLTTWAVCPKRFDFQVRQGHPGAPARPEVAAHRPRVDGERLLDAGVRRVGARVGDLTHRALERNIDDVDALAVHDDRLERTFVERALELAAVFRNAEAFRPFRDGAETRAELRVSLELSAATVHGRADLVGNDFVLDYKTGESEVDDAHQLQVAVYAEALRRQDGRERVAHIAYLRTADEGGPRLETLAGADRDAALGRAEQAAAGIRRGDLQATPGRERCARCAFEAICDRSAWRDGAHDDR
jgi:ATP-dependent helicase/nuclease subunit A